MWRMIALVRAMMSFSRWTVDCNGIPETATKWSPYVRQCFRLLFGLKQGDLMCIGLGKLPTDSAEEAYFFGAGQSHFYWDPVR